MYDVTQRDTFDDIDFWLNDIKNKLGPDYPMIYAIVGNKIDLADQISVPIEDAHKYAKQNGINIVRETSAKDDTGVTEVFESVGRAL